MSYKAEDFYPLKLKAMWAAFKREHFSFWMLSCYFVFEYVRPQSIFPAIDFLPWAQLFLILSLLGLFAEPNKKKGWHAISFWMLMFQLVIIASSYAARYPSISWARFNDFFSWLAIYFLITYIVNSKVRFYIFLMIFCLASFKLSLGLTKVWAMRGFSFTSWGLQGPPGYFANSGELAIQMLVFFALSFYLYRALKPSITQLWEKILLLSFPVTSVLVIVGASSRGAQLALLLQLALIFYKSIFKPKMLISVLLLGFVLYILLPEEQKVRFTNIGEDTTSQQRILYWKSGYEMLNENKFLGVGYFNFPSVFADKNPDRLFYGRAELPHNIFIQVGSELGWTGLVIYIVLVFKGLFIYRRIIRNAQDDPVAVAISKGLCLGFFGFVVAGNFVSVVYYPFMWIHLALSVALLNIVMRKEVVKKPKNQDGSRKGKLQMFV